MKRRSRLEGSPRDLCLGTNLTVLPVKCTLLVALLTCLGCQDVQEAVPRSLHGTWAAPGSIYDGRTMEIREQQISFDIEGGDAVAHRVVRVMVASSGGEERVYALDYVADHGAEYRLHIRYQPVSGELRLGGRRQVIWKKVSG